MTFSSQAKDELIRVPMDRACCLLSELAAFTQTSGSLGFLGGGRFTVTYQVEHPGTARRIFRILREGLRLSPRLHVVTHRRLGGQKTCVITVEEEDARQLLTVLDMMELSADGSSTLKRTVPRPQLNRQCCRRAYLRGAFLGAGSMMNPEKGYLMEWVAEDESLAQSLEKVLERSEIQPRVSVRRGQHVVSLRSGQPIADVLAMMGASQAVMDLENVRITRQLRGHANRAANCDLHNTGKTMQAAQAQLAAIRGLSEQGLDRLPPALREIAEKRLENPDLSLEDLGSLLDPPVGKSGVNHRLRRLMALWEESRKEERRESDDEDNHPMDPNDAGEPHGSGEAGLSGG